MELTLEKPYVPVYPEKTLLIPVGVSNRHVHLSAVDLATLFGEEYVLEPLKQLSQPGEFASRAVVALVGPKGVIEGVRVLGPTRKQTQVEISMTDSYRLGVKPPVRLSSQLAGTPGIALIGPKGLISLQEGLIIAARHIHMPEAVAHKLHLEDGSSVRVHIEGVRAQIFENVILRVSPAYSLELHIDTDEANGALLKNGDEAILLV